MSSTPEPPDWLLPAWDAVPDDPQDFGFTTTGGLNPAAFTLDDDGDPTFSNTQAWTGLTNFTTYTVTETGAPGWALTFGSPVCSVTSAHASSRDGLTTSSLKFPVPSFQFPADLFS